VAEEEHDRGEARSGTAALPGAPSLLSVAKVEGILWR
jgi:hypothetical protein